jgi:acetylornithine deacetylase/succinyl-diaminopimelate desuccinylase-like protein
MDTHLGPLLAKFTHPILGGSTLNIGVIRGGSRPNIVPDQAEAQLDIRITPALAASGGALGLLQETISCHELPVEIVNPHENPPMETDPGHPMIQRLLKTDSSCSLTGAPWFSDAAHLANGGTPAICIGPGSIEQAHTADEFIELGALERGADIFTRFIRGLAD